MRPEPTRAGQGIGENVIFKNEAVGSQQSDGFLSRFATSTPKTKCSNRIIPINDFVIKELKADKQRQEDYAKLLGNDYDKSHNFIVLTVFGKPYVNLSAINRVVNRLTEKAGLPHCTIHGFRHSVASILDDNGVPIQDISVLLGHESTNTTERIYINRRKTAKETTMNTNFK